MLAQGQYKVSVSWVWGMRHANDGLQKQKEHIEHIEEAVRGRCCNLDQGMKGWNISRAVLTRVALRVGEVMQHLARGLKRASQKGRGVWEGGAWGKVCKDSSHDARYIVDCAYSWVFWEILCLHLWSAHSCPKATSCQLNNCNLENSDLMILSICQGLTWPEF